MNVSSWAHTVFYLLGNIFLPHKRPLQTTGAQIKNSCKNWNRSFSAFYIFLPLLLVLLSPSLWQWQHWDQMVIEGCHLSQRKTLSSMSLCTPQGRERESAWEKKWTMHCCSVTGWTQAQDPDTGGKVRFRRFMAGFDEMERRGLKAGEGWGFEERRRMAWGRLAGRLGMFVSTRKDS